MSNVDLDAATDLWEQIFSRLTKSPGAALLDPEYDEQEDEEKANQAFLEAGWSENEIKARKEISKQNLASAPVTSPGVNPNVEYLYKILCDDIEAAMKRLNLVSYESVVRGIEPKATPFAAKTNVIMTSGSVITVSAFLFRYCGLIARAFTRTLLLNPTLWESKDYTIENGRSLINLSPQLGSGPIKGIPTATFL